MRNRLTLRTYIILAFAIYSLIITIIAASITLIFLEKLDDKLITKTALREAQMISQNYIENPGKFHFYGNYFKLYISSPDHKANLPPEISRITNKLKFNEVILNNIEYNLIHINKYPYNFYFLYDFTEFESFEFSVELSILIYTLITLLIGLGIGVYASEKVIKPIHNLVESLDQGSAENGIVQIPRDFVNDELGILANKFSEYNEKIKGYIDREKAFTSNASHEIRTPVSVIAGAVELLEGSSTLSQMDRDIVARIKHEVDVMRELIHVLLAVSRGETQPWKQEHIKANALIQENIDKLIDQAHTKEIEFNYIQNSKLVVNGSRQALDIILRNLLTNAILYTSKGTVTITVNHESISIKDSGPGIPDDIQKKVFERFFRGQKQSVTNNSGIGLALVKQLCEANQWIISLQENVDGIGTKVELSF